MLILGIDTSGKSGGITLAQGDRQSFRVVESAPIAGGTFSAQLVPAIAALLEKRGFAARDIGGFAAASGPGSFTGLRVGLSAVKGLAEALGAPIATASLLEALASLSSGPGTVAAALDAGRSEVFFGLYRVSAAGEATRINEALLSQSAFLQHLDDGNLQGAITSDHPLALLAAAERSSVQIQVAERPGSEMIARLGLRKLLNGETVSVEALDATYMRRSNAEIFSADKDKR
ncbi:MAG TPA: tRNA (adenosine(37)-N6)-threonylcarbamoyltransferase complex dimerization subunit type 1 TsaB [Candidatus Angelobacter sp.]